MAFDYADAYRKVRPYVMFDYGRRTRFNPGEKAAIRKAYNAYVEARRAGAVLKKIRRNPHESVRAYKRRVAAIKASVGQRGNPLKAVSLKGTSPNDTISIKGTTVTVRNRKTDRRSQYYGIDHLELVMRPESVLIDVYRTALEDGWDTISYMHGMTRGQEEFVLARDPETGEADYGVFLDTTLQMLNLYPRGRWQYIIAAFVAFKGGAVKRIG